MNQTIQPRKPYDAEEVPAAVTLMASAVSALSSERGRGRNDSAPTLGARLRAYWRCYAPGRAVSLPPQRV